jgi:hypothetical protein
MDNLVNFFQRLLRHGLAPKPRDVNYIPVNVILNAEETEGNQKKRKAVDETANEESKKVRIHFVCILLSFYYSFNHNFLFINQSKVIDKWYDKLLANTGKFEVVKYTLEKTDERGPLDVEVIVSKDSTLKKNGIALSKVLLGDGEVLVQLVNCEYSHEEMVKELVFLNTDHNLCPYYYQSRILS